MCKLNDTAKLLKYCADSVSENLDWNTENSADTEFKPMSKIESINQLYKCIDYITETYSDIAKPKSLEGVGYYIYTYISGVLIQYLPLLLYIFC